MTSHARTFKVCNAIGCTKRIWHLGAHSLEDAADKRCQYVSAAKKIVSTPSHQDEYFSFSKLIHRHQFTVACMRGGEENAILYTESSDGATTYGLLKAGFHEWQLHPCNDNQKSPNATAKLQTLFPNAVVETGDIHDVYKKQKWLGVWFDLEETWHTKQEWNLDRIPDFHQTTVVAVSLSSRGIKGGAEALAKDLDHLLQDKGGAQPALSTAYDGKAGCMNMVYGFAFFEKPPITPMSLFTEIHLKELCIPVNEFAHLSARAWPDKEKYKVICGCYHACVKALNGEMFQIHYLNVDNNYFMEYDEVAFNKVKEWWSTKAASSLSLSPSSSHSSPSSFVSSSSLKRMRTNVCPRCNRKKGRGSPPTKQWFCEECS